MNFKASKHDPDRGATVLLIALVMVVIMGIAAVVIDGGFGFSEKRQAQSGVDFASMAALAAATGSDPVEAGADEAKEVVAANLPGRSLDWDACTDPNRPAEYTRVSSTPCISFTHNFSQARVRLPADAVDTTFARLIGFNEIIVRAEAEAEQVIDASADVLPWTAGSGSLVCLFSNQAPQTVPPCDGPAIGFFGYLDIALYGDLDNPWTCALGTSNTRSAINIAKGADHNMNEYDGGAIVNDHDACANLSEDVNQLEIKTGSPTQGATDGLIHGVSGSINGQPFGPESGRIHWSRSPTGNTTPVRGTQLDDTPLWHYLIGGICNGVTVSTQAEMETCLESWSGGPIFTKEIEEHPRFGAVPKFNVYPPTPPNAYLIDHFSPVWIETIYQSCSANTCRTVFTPGGEGDGSAACPTTLEDDPQLNCGHSNTTGTDSVEGVTAFQLKVGMLDPETQESFPGRPGLREINLLR